jgi:hypothetical protein
MTVQRIDRGRGHSYKIDGDKVPGVTTIIGDGVPKPALVTWASGTVAEIVAEGLRPVTINGEKHILADDLLAELARIGLERGHPLPEKFTRTKIAEALKYLPYADRDAAANRGTEVHGIAEKLATGAEVDVPEPLKGHVESYLKFRRDWQPYDELVEFVVAHRAYRWCGTGDVMCRFKVPPLDDGLWLLDIKTNRSGPFGEVGLQLAGYRYAETYIDADGVERPMPDFAGALVLWLRGDGYDLKPVQAGPDELRALRYVQQVAWWAKERSRELVGASLRPERAS